MRFLRRLLITVVVLALLAVAADRVACWAFERTFAREATAQTDANGVSASIHGFPFLTQLWNGSLDDVTVRAGSASLGGTTVTDVDVDGSGVSLTSPYVVTDGTVHATVPVATLEQVVAQRTGSDVTIAATDDGLVATTKVLGIGVGLVLDPKVSGGALAVDVKGAKIAGATVSADSLPGGLANTVSGLKVPLDLPKGVTLTGADVVPASGDDDGGVRVSATGSDVALEHLASS
ncbi:hypothetical protein GCM10025864_16560 [Luteimicrobium album]|uniref:DUF2993 domain-containing protein n=1 Tax=Luteimicrobium album TaxID=1054550 RepID=A0ABQ6I0Z6_9MICO|nr:DUF2993 domain-containing protein [Luteimicrobium album]GMA23897.1 hypothetical protein GCM10025864_16560 [Luteimicrobium album]